MPHIFINQFQGVAPRIDERLLAPSQGQTADNIRLTSGALQSWRETVLVDTPAKTGTLQTIYLYQGTGSDLWLHWTQDVNVVKSPISDDTTDRIYWTGEGVPKAANNEDSSVFGVDATGGTSEYPENSITLGAPAPTAAPTVAIGGSGAGTNPVDVVYVYTFVSVWGEESAPSPASAVITVDHTDGDVDLSAMQTTWAAGYNTLDKTRIYRSLSGTEAAEYQFVAELDPPAATYTDSIDNSALGEILPSDDYDIPPTDMFGLLDFGNGIFVGFTEYEVCFSEPYQPHAWPIKYRLAVTDKIIGGGVYGNTLVVCTDDHPVLITGNHPSVMTQAVHPARQACVSKRGIVSMKDRVIYPTPYGLFSIGYGGAINLTESLYDQDDWLGLNPDQIKAAFWNTRYIGFTDTGGIALEMANNNLIASQFDDVIDSLFTDPETGRMYVCKTVDTVSEIHEFDAGGERVSYKWRSKKFSFRELLTLTAGKIIANYGDLLTPDEITALNAEIAAVISANSSLLAGVAETEVNGQMINDYEVNGGLIQTPPEIPTAQNVVIRLYGDGVLFGTYAVTNDRPFRFPSGKRARQYEVEIEAFTDVYEITVASSVEDLVV